MKENHILIEKAFVYDNKRKETNLEKHYYDDIKGYWRNKINNFASIKDNGFKKPSTKKCDVETGEDQKGE